MTDCRCHLPLTRPSPRTRGERWWLPHEDDDPGAPIMTVVRLGEQPHLYRWVRRPDGMWESHGKMVNFYTDITPPHPWAEIGRCWAGHEHAVLPCWERPGRWEAGAPTIVAERPREVRPPGDMT